MRIEINFVHNIIQLIKTSHVRYLLSHSVLLLEEFFLYPAVNEHVGLLFKN